MGHIPKHIVLGLVDLDAYNGSFRTNIFYCKHRHLTQVGVYVDGEQILRKPLFLNFDAAGGQCDSRLSIKSFLWYWKAFTGYGKSDK